MAAALTLWGGFGEPPWQSLTEQHMQFPPTRARGGGLRFGGNTPQAVGDLGNMPPPSWDDAPDVAGDASDQEPPSLVNRSDSGSGNSGGGGNGAFDGEGAGVPTPPLLRDDASGGGDSSDGGSSPGGGEGAGSHPHRAGTAGTATATPPEHRPQTGTSSSLSGASLRRWLRR